MRRRFFNNKIGEKIDLSKPYFAIEALEDDLIVNLSADAYEYCIDDGVWKKANSITRIQTNAGQTLYFRGNLTPTSSVGIGTFTILKKCNVSGNIMSLLFGDNFEEQTDLSGKDYAFKNLFCRCSTIIDASQLTLPATKLVEGCYYYMFYGCTSLVTAPSLPATTLAENCYSSIFRECSSLVTAPALPATTLANSCYASMFSYCTSLVSAPELPATTLAERCYNYMFYGTNVLPDCTNIDFTSESVVASGGLIGLFAETKVTDEDLYTILPINPSTGKYWLPVTTLGYMCYNYMFYGCTSLVTAPELPATTLANYCYDSMFKDCKSLVTVPELPATSLAPYCYYDMFYNCSSLVTAPTLPATTLANNCYSYMFYGCTSLVTAPELPATTLTKSCYSYMFSGCSSLVTVPELPATSLAYYCYTYMFYNCRKLNYIKALFTTTPNITYTDNWVKGVSSTGTFVKNIEATWNVTGENGIPSGWTVQTA